MPAFLAIGPAFLLVVASADRFFFASETGAGGEVVAGVKPGEGIDLASSSLLVLLSLLLPLST